MRMRWTLPLAAAACLPLAAHAADKPPMAEVFAGTYRMDCMPVGPIAQQFRQACEAGRAAGTWPTYRFTMDKDGRWTVTPALSGTEPSQVLEVSQYEGHPCLKSPLMVVCAVPRNTDLIKNTAPDSNVRSRSGMVVLATNVGAIDLIKVAKQ